MPRKPRTRKKTFKAQTLFRWFGYLLIVSVPIAVVAVTFYSEPRQQFESAWTRTVAQTSEPAFTMRTRQKTAAIFDQVAVYNINQKLIEEVRDCLVGAGYRVEVFSGVQVTVDLYRKLPSREYDVIILRVHSTSTVDLGQGRTASGAPVVLLTGEPYSSLSYPYEQTMGRVRAVKIDAGTFFGVGPDFVTASMEGTFPGTLIVVAGCESMVNKDLAKALTARGASRVVGWTNSVTLDHNDKAIASLARNLFKKGLQVLDAVQVTMNEIGKDPDSQASLVCYP